MGCDIHAHFEIKINNEWLYYSEPDIDRNYDLFTLMADVRNYDRGIKPISKPRGLPKDITKTTALKNKWWTPDGHSHSWLNSKEVTKVIDWHKKQTDDYLRHSRQWGYLDGNGWNWFLKSKQDYPEEIQDFRLIFWFDN